MLYFCSDLVVAISDSSSYFALLLINLTQPVPFAEFEELIVYEEPEELLIGFSVFYWSSLGGLARHLDIVQGRGKNQEP